MTFFEVAADSYDRFMGRYSKRLAPLFLDFARVEEGPVLDVGCGPGVLTETLVGRFGAENVAAVDPSEPLVAAARERTPGVRVELAAAEDLPFADDEFGAALAQLVVHFMTDPEAGLREMARVTRAGGVVAACVWDLAGGQGPSSPFWDAARAVDPGVVDESDRPGGRAGHLAELLDAVGLREIEDGAVSFHADHTSFDEYWEPFTMGVGPAGSYLANLDPEQQAFVRERCRSSLPAGSFALHLRAWAARGVV